MLNYLKRLIDVCLALNVFEKDLEKSHKKAVKNLVDKIYNKLNKKIHRLWFEELQ